MEIAIEKKLMDLFPNIQKWTEKVYKKCKKRLPLEDAEIEVRLSDKSNNLEDLNGIGGYCPSKSHVRISVDLKHPNFSYTVFSLTLTHELYHLARRQSGIKIGEDSFLECLLSEGLADRFCYEIFGQTPIWVSPLSGGKAQVLLKKAAPLLDVRLNDKLYDQWFLYGDPGQLAKWSGYSLGYALVAQILKKDKKLNSISFLDVPAKEIADITVLYDKV